MSRVTEFSSTCALLILFVFFNYNFLFSFPLLRPTNHFDFVAQRCYFFFLFLFLREQHADKSNDHDKYHVTTLEDNKT